MQTDNLSKYIISTASKYLSAVDISNYKSSLNEFDDVSNIHLILGNEKLLDVPAQFLYLTDDDYEDLFDIGSISWYDARENSTSCSKKFGLFYSENIVMCEAHEGDLLVIALRPDKSVMVFIAKSETSAENRLLWLFGAAETTFKINANLASKDVNINTRFILRELGVNVEQEIEPVVIEDMIK